jgi:putative redox protein
MAVEATGPLGTIRTVRHEPGTGRLEKEGDVGRRTLTPVSAGTQHLVRRRGLSFEGEDSRGFHLAISGDPEIEGAKPSDLLPLALASCLAYDVVVVLEKKRQELRSVVVDIESEQEDVAPFRFVRITARFEVSGVIEKAAADRALELAEKNCPVLASLSPDIDVVTSITVGST